MSGPKTCRTCGVTYPADEAAVLFAPFRRHEAQGMHTLYSATCRPCQQTKRDTVKVANRWPQKMRDTLKRHAGRLGYSVSDLALRFGWNLSVMEHEARHAYANGCPYCHKSFKSMGRDLFNITLDIVNPAIPPDFITNTRWVCDTCNRAKGGKDPSSWGAYMAGFRRHEEEARRQPRQLGFWGDATCQ